MGGGEGHLSVDQSILTAPIPISINFSSVSAKGGPA